MNRKRRVAIAISLVTIITTALPIARKTVAYAQDQFQTDEQKQEIQQTSDFVRGRLLVRFRSETMSLARRDLIAEAGARDAGTLPATGVHILELPVEADEEATVRALQTRPEVEFAELDRLIPPAEVTPNDPWYANWEWHLRKIQAPTAWETAVGSNNVVIAVLDTGVDSAHEDLSSKLVPGWNVYGNNSDTRDINGHGTQVAGTAAASSNNAIGVASLAWGCLLMPIRISDNSGFATFSAMASGLTWAADHGARVANISYRASTSSTVASAAQYFQNHGGVVAIAAGNEGVFDPSSDNPYVLTVGGTDSTDALYPWSNTGNNLDVVAPGSAYTSVNGGGYTAASGTSIAAPIVSSLAALLFSINPSLTGDEVQTLIKQSADDIGSGGWDTSYGWGRVNAARAVSIAGGGIRDTTPPVVSFTSPGSAATVSRTISVAVSATDNRGVTAVNLSVDGTVIGTDNAGPYSFQWNTIGWADGSHTLTATALDAAGNSATATIPVIVSNPMDTTPPTITILSPASGARIGTSVTVSVSAFDQVGVVRVELYVDGALIANSTSSPFTTRWNSRRARAGSHTLQCKAYDSAGNVGVSPNCVVYR